MNPLTISSSATLAPAYKPAIILDSPVKNTPGINNNGTSVEASGLLNDHPGQFAYALAQELRGPLANINLSIEMLDSIIKENKLEVYMDVITRSSMRINNLIDEFLKYQQADEVQLEEHSIPQLLDEILEMAEEWIELKNITVIKEYTAGNHKILLHRPRMKIALSNIINNAMSALALDTGELKLVTKTVNGRFVLQIEDNGQGISRANQEQLFQPYYSYKPGLGLSATYDVLRSNYVGVIVDSKKGRGTCFTLMFNKSQPV